MDRARRRTAHPGSIRVVRSPQDSGPFLAVANGPASPAIYSWSLMQGSPSPTPINAVLLELAQARSNLPELQETDRRIRAAIQSIRGFREETESRPFVCQSMGDNLHRHVSERRILEYTSRMDELFAWSVRPTVPDNRHGRCPSTKRFLGL